MVFGGCSAPLTGTDITLGITVTYPIHRTPAAHAVGGTALQWSKGKGRLWLLPAGWSGDHQPRAQVCAACKVPGGALAQGKGDVSVLFLSTSSPETFLPSTSCHSSTEMSPASSFYSPWFQGLQAPGKTHPEPSIRSLPRSAKEPRQGLAAEEHSKTANLKAYFFTNPKAEACWYSMYLEGLVTFSSL